MDLVDQSIERLKLAATASEKYYHAPLIILFSGGKDSSVCAEIAQRAGVEIEIQHNLTTADAPETIRFIRQEFRRFEGKGIKCCFNFPHYKGKPCTMWNLIQKKMIPPTRRSRYCCEVLKEVGGAKRYAVTGVRWAESESRKEKRGVHESGKDLILFNDNDDRRRLIERCQMKARTVCNPIIDWTDAEIWDFIKADKVPVNPLYECGFDRVGCVGCPMAKKHNREREFAKWPGYKRLYIRAFDKMLEERERRGKLEGGMRWGSTGEDVFHWWMEDGVLPGQETLEGFGETDEI